MADGPTFATPEEALAALQASQDVMRTQPQQTRVGFATPEEALAALRAAPAPTQEAAPAQNQSTMAERISQDFQQRTENVNESLQAFTEGQGQYTNALGQPDGQASFSNLLTQLAGQAVAGPVLDVSGELITTGAGKVYGLLPDSFRGKAAEYASNALNWVMESPVAEEAWYYAQQGAEAYSGWKRRNPNSARTLESIVDVGAAVPSNVATSSLLRRVPGLPGKPLLLRGADVFDRSARESRRSYATEIMRPTKTDVSPAQATQSRTGRQRVELGSWEKETVNELIRLPLKPRGTALENWQIVNKRVEDLARSLEADLADIPVSKQRVRDFIANNVAESSETTLFIRQNPQFRGILDDLVAKADELILASDGTGRGILQARRELDDWVRQQKASFNFNDPALTPLNEAVRSIRGAMNEALEASAPGQNVLGRLTQQSRLLSAADNLRDAYAKEAPTALGRLMQGIREGTGVHLPSTPLAVGATVGALGSLAGSPWAAYVAIPLAIGAGATLAYRGVMSPTTSRALAELLRGANRLVETTKDPILNSMYIADRAVLIDLIRNTQVSEEEEQTSEPR